MNRQTLRMPSSIRTLLAGLGVVILWASAFPAIRLAAPELGVFGLSIVRLGVAALALCAVAPFAGVRLPALRDLPLIVGCGFFGMAAYQLLLTRGELDVPAGTASIIVATAPVVSIALAALVFRERLTVFRIVGSIVAIGGVCTVTLARSGVSVSGAVWIVVGATVVQGIYHPLTRPLLKKYSGLEVATYGMVIGFVMLLPTLPAAIPQFAAASAAAWWSAAYLGVLPSAVGFVLWGYAVARLPVATSTSLLYLVPVFAVAIAFVWLGEIPFIGELLGGVVVLLGVVTIGFGRRIADRVRRRESTLPIPATATATRR